MAPVPHLAVAALHRRLPRRMPRPRHPRVVFAELKRETGKLTPAQTEWLDDLAAAGVETYLWRPSMIDEIADAARACRNAPRPTRPWRLEPKTRRKTWQSKAHGTNRMAIRRRRSPSPHETTRPRRLQHPTNRRLGQVLQLDHHPGHRPRRRLHHPAHTTRRPATHRARLRQGRPPGRLQSRRLRRPLLHHRPTRCRHQTGQPAGHTIDESGATYDENGLCKNGRRSDGPAITSALEIDGRPYCSLPTMGDPTKNTGSWAI